MRIPLIILSIFLLKSCSSGITKEAMPANLLDTTIELKESLGQLKLTIPNRYDTFLVWTQHSDCSSCGTERYRFQRKKYPIFQESGFFWNNLKDSIDQLTIIHSQYIIINDSATSEIMKMIHRNLVEDAKVDPLSYRDKKLQDTLFLMNGQWKSLIIATSYDSLNKQYSKTVWGAFLQKGNLIKIQFSLLTKDKDSINVKFITESRQQIMRIFERNSM